MLWSLTQPLLVFTLSVRTSYHRTKLLSEYPVLSPATDPADISQMALRCTYVRYQSGMRP